MKRQHRIKMLAKARQVDDELREDQRILEELKSFTKKEEEEESKKVLEARAKQLQWLDGVSISFLIFKSKYYLKIFVCRSSTKIQWKQLFLNGQI